MQTQKYCIKYMNNLHSQITHSTQVPLIGISVDIGLFISSCNISAYAAFEFLAALIRICIVCNNELFGSDFNLSNISVIPSVIASSTAFFNPTSNSRLHRRFLFLFAFIFNSKLSILSSYLCSKSDKSSFDTLLSCNPPNFKLLHRTSNLLLLLLGVPYSEYSLSSSSMSILFRCRLGRFASFGIETGSLNRK